MARLLKKEGVLPLAKVVELSGESVVGEYLGQTQARMTEKLKEAQGGVLFIGKNVCCEIYIFVCIKQLFNVKTKPTVLLAVVDLVPMRIKRKLWEF